MEALVGVALAGNVLEFIRFGIDVFATGRAIKHSHDGALKRHTDLQVVVDDLDQRLSLLEGGDSANLQKLVDRCKAAGAELREMLLKVTAKGDQRNAFTNYRHALRSCWHEKDLEERVECFRNLRDELILHIQTLMMTSVSANLQRSEAIERVAERNSSSINSMRSAGENAVQRILECVESSRNTILCQCRESSPGMETLILELRAMGQILHELKCSNSEPTAGVSANSNEAFLETLEFREMYDREENIPKAHRRTYEWVLEETESEDISLLSKRKRLRDDLMVTLENLGVSKNDREEVSMFQDVTQSLTSSLHQWLRDGDRVFWIWGKPGCGKSTLMKAMLGNKTMRTNLTCLLSNWANTDLIIAKFFFFRPGAPLQKSQQGFLQALLHQILSQRKTLIDKIFTSQRQIQAIARAKSGSGTNGSIWNVNELRRALYKWREVDDSALYIHVDGIDEIDCEPRDLARLLGVLALAPKLKILAAGRYHADFNADFACNQRLNIHELTEPDILRYIIGKLNVPELWELFSQKQRSAQFCHIVKEIASAAQGVFQWVKIVVESLLQGVRYFENFDKLSSRLREYPRDLDKLYRFLYDSIDQRYATDAAFWILQVYFASGRSFQSHFTINTYLLSLAETYDLHDADWLKDRAPGRKNKAPEDAQGLQRRMQAQCPHFFDYGGQKKRVKSIHFSHRTVLDFLTLDKGKIISSLTAQMEVSQTPMMASAAIRFIADVTSHPRSEAFPRLSLPFESNLAGLIRYVSQQDFLSLWKQLTTAFDEYAPAYETAHESMHRTCVPGLTSFVCGSLGQHIERMRNLKGRMLHTAVIFRNYGRLSMFTSLDSQLVSRLDLDDNERELLLLECQHCEIRRSGFRRTDVWNSKDIASKISALFPNGVRFESPCLMRVLERIRANLNRERAKYPLELSDFLAPLFHMVRLLIEHGANPNTMVRGIQGEDDLSLLSIRAMISVDGADQLAIPRSNTAVCQLQNLLIDVGASVIVIPLEEHKMEPVEVDEFEFE